MHYFSFTDEEGNSITERANVEKTSILLSRPDFLPPHSGLRSKKKMRFISMTAHLLSQLCFCQHHGGPSGAKQDDNQSPNKLSQFL